ncbi:hypothetical protein CVT24_004139 [Panaeolus cyanescens]|uniref:Zinc finger PHD-type domain-containing protein n=1 Tax=Panaeolus cyanescens TaxID=181874 RepID=A0A409Y623_9AGAR|nr:hypothetical protein CVT24_004139 [Panaeolus cyanescens]
MSCVSCAKSDTSARNFLLDCTQCKRSWHHRCHKPPVPDLELIKYIKQLTDLRKQSVHNQNVPQRPTFICGPCKKPVVASKSTTKVEIIVIDDDSDPQPTKQPAPKPQIASKKSTRRGPSPLPLAQVSQPAIHPRQSNSPLLSSNELRQTTSDRDHVTVSPPTPNQHSEIRSRAVKAQSSVQREVSFIETTSNQGPTTSKQPSLARHKSLSLPRLEALSMTLELDEEEEEDELATDSQLSSRRHESTITDPNSSPAEIPLARQPITDNLTAVSNTPKPSSMPLPDLFIKEYADVDDAWTRAAVRRRQPSIPHIPFSQRKRQMRPAFKPSKTPFDFNVDAWMMQKRIS